MPGRVAADAGFAGTASAQNYNNIIATGVLKSSYQSKWSSFGQPGNYDPSQWIGNTANFWTLPAGALWQCKATDDPNGPYGFLSGAREFAKCVNGINWPDFWVKAGASNALPAPNGGPALDEWRQVCDCWGDATDDPTFSGINSKHFADCYVTNVGGCGNGTAAASSERDAREASTMNVILTLIGQDDKTSAAVNSLRVTVLLNMLSVQTLVDVPGKQCRFAEPACILPTPAPTSAPHHLGPPPGPHARTLRFKTVAWLCNTAAPCGRLLDASATSASASPVGWPRALRAPTPDALWLRELRACVPCDRKRFPPPPPSRTLSLFCDCSCTD